MKSSQPNDPSGHAAPPPSHRAARSASLEVASSELTRDLNRDAVLELIRSLQPISRVDLARASGLQPSTISSIVEYLLNERWIRESAMVKTARGRRPTLLSLNDDVVFLVADIRPSHAVVALIDLNGRFLERKALPIGRSPAASLARIAATMQEFRHQHSAHAVQGVGVSLPGRVDPKTDRLLLAPNLPWPDFPIGTHLQQLLGLEVHLENASNASLLGELCFGRIGGIRNSMLVTIGEGVGAAMLVDGRLISGQNGLAGEFGHIPLDPEGPLCACGARGCWEQFSSSRAALRYYAEALALPPGQAPVRSVLELLSLAEDGDPAADTALTRQARAIGQGLHLLNAIMSPELILLSCDVTAYFDRYRGIIEAECREGAMDGIGPQLVAVADSEIIRLRGAAAVVLARHPGYPRAAHRRGDVRPSS